MHLRERGLAISRVKRAMDALRRFSNRGSPPENDKVNVEQLTSIDELLRQGERIVWRSAPSRSHSWADRDQLEAPGSSGTQPESIIGRAVFMVFLGSFFAFLGFGGLVLLLDVPTEVTRAGGANELFAVVFRALLGLTLLSTWTLLASPWAAMRRADHLHYLITSERLIILRRGPEWSLVALRGPIVLCFSTLCVLGVSGLSIHSIAQLVQYFSHDGMGAVLAQLLLIAVLILPVVVIFGTVGSIGLYLQVTSIVDAFRNPGTLHCRSISLDGLPPGRPSVARLRSDGVGDVLFGCDAFWDSGSDSPGSGSYAAVDVGFLSVPGAEDVADRIRLALKRAA